MRSHPGLVVAVLAILAATPWSVGSSGRVPARVPIRGRRVRAAPWRLGGAGPAVSRALLRSARGRESGWVDAAVVVDLAAAALASGASVPAALVALGEALGVEGRVLRRVGAVLLLGGTWAEAWAGAPDRLRVLDHALEPAWVDGVPAGPLLTRAADQLRAGQARAAEEAAGRLGVRLVLPLGLCFLPAFVLLGLVPVLVSTGVGLAG